MKTKSNKFLVSLMLTIAMVFTTISPLFAVEAAIPTPPANTHPRVLFTAADVASIKAVVEGTITERNDSELDSARAYFKRRADVRAEDNTDNGDPDNHNDGWNEKKLAGIEAKALAYVLQEDVHNTSIKKSGRDTTYQELGARAVQYLKKYLETVDMSDITDETSCSRNAGQIMRVAAEVYDWCYDLFDTPIQKVAVTAGDTTDYSGQTVTVTKAEIRNLVSSKLLAYMEMGSSFSKQDGMVGHGSEAQLLRDGLSWAIAVYDEAPSIWNNQVGKRFYDEYVPIRNHFLPTAWNLQGTEYGFYRNQFDAWSYLLITGMGLQSPYNDDAVQGLGDSALGMTYARRPDGQFFRDGDVPITANNYFSKWNKYNMAFLDAAVGQNPYVYGEYIETMPSGQSFYEDTAVPILVMSGRNNAALAKTTPKSTKNLPLTKFFGGSANIMFARTGWSEGPDSNVAAAMMKIGGEFVDNHQHYDAGTFQLYYKGILASESGIYQGASNSDYSSNHRAKYAIRTIAHNGMLIGTSNSQTEQFNVSIGTEPEELGDQKTVASLSSYEVDQTNPENPSYSYVKGDLTSAYGGGVNYKRSYVFLNFKEDDVPAALVVYDYVGSTSTKKWLVHGINQPTITVSNKQAVFTNTRSDASGSYNGKMTLDTLLPASTTYSTVSGCKVGSSTYDATPSTNVDEGKGYRLEVAGKGSDHQFLNVMQVSDANKSNYKSATVINGTNVVGTKIGDKVVTFSANGGQITDSFSFTAPAGTYEYILTDVKRGAWQVNGGEYIGTSNANDGNVLHFTKTLDSAQTLTFTWHEFGGTGITAADRTMGESTMYDFYSLSYGEKDSDDNYVEVDTEADVITDENGMPLIAVEDLAEAMDAEVSVVGDTATFTKDGKTAAFTVGSATITEDGNVFTKDTQATPVMFRDHMYVSPITVAPYFLARFTFDRAKGVMVVVANAATGDLSIEYSADGINYTPVPGFAFATRTYNVELPYQTNVAYVRVVNSLGAQYFSTTNTIENENAEGQSDFTWDDVAANGWSNDEADFAKEQYGLERFLSASRKTADDSVVTIKNEAGTMKMYYQAPGENGYADVFTVNFTAPQPKLTSVNSNVYIKYEHDDTTDRFYYSPVYIGGGAAWNDNGTILDATTQSPHREGSSGSGYRYKSTIWALGHISPSLQGASQFVLPLTAISDSASICAGETPTVKELMSFSASAPGRVVVLMADAANSKSDYLTSYYWHQGKNNGVNITGIATSSANNSPVTKVGSSASEDPEYYAVAYKWRTSQKEQSEENVVTGLDSYRTYNPGVINKPLTDMADGNGNAAADTQKMQYSYYMDFNEGETVSIPNPLNFDKYNFDGSNGLYAETPKADLMTVFVIYDDDPTPPITGDGLQIQYSGEDKVFASINSNDISDTKELTVELPDDSKYGYLKFDSLNEIPDNVTYTWSVGATDEYDNALIGTNSDDNVMMGTNSYYQTKVPVYAQTENGAYKIPIKNENSTAYFTYNGQEYVVYFKAKQPRLTEFNSYTSNAYGTPVFVSGAAANNDNGSVTLTSKRGSGNQNAPVAGNISKKLLGTSMFMIPELYDADQNKDVIFSFKADHAGWIYLATDTYVNKSTYTGYQSWEQVTDKNPAENVAKMIADTTDTSYKKLIQPRTFNDYESTGVDYFYYSINYWYKGGNYQGINDGLNGYRTTNPGVNGEITYNSDATLAPTNGSWYSKFVYRRYFDEGELVEIPGYAKTTDSVFFIDWLPTQEDKPLNMSFSSDDQNYAPVSFDITKNDYSVVLPDNAKYGYINFKVPSGTEGPTNVKTTWNTEGAIATGRAIGAHSKAQIEMPMPAQTSSSGAYIIPIKSEAGTLHFDYKNRSYSVTLMAKQPQLTITDDYSTNEQGGVLFVSGGAANNDNNTLIESSAYDGEMTATDDSTGTGTQIRMLGNISNKLLGSSIFMLPKSSGNEGNTWFKFTADHAGTVYVLSDTAISNTEYNNGDWECLNSGTADSLGILDGSRLVKPRTVNNYPAETAFEAYAISTAIWTATNSSDPDSTVNTIRWSKMGIDHASKTGQQPKIRSNSANDAYTAGSWAMTYAYKLSFDEGEEVTIPTLGNTSIDSAIFVVWDNDDMSGIAYESDDSGEILADADGNITIDANQLKYTTHIEDDVTVVDANEQLLIVTYDEDGRMTDIKTATSGIKTYNVGEFVDSKEANGILGIFVNDLKTFKPIFTKKYDIYK